MYFIRIEWCCICPHNLLLSFRYIVTDFSVINILLYHNFNGWILNLSANVFPGVCNIHSLCLSQLLHQLSLLMCVMRTSTTVPARRPTLGRFPKLLTYTCSIGKVQRQVLLSTGVSCTPNASWLLDTSRSCHLFQHASTFNKYVFPYSPLICI